MKPIILAIALMATILLPSCATATPTPMPTPISVSDAADCANLPATGPKIKIEGPWVPSTNVADLDAAAASAMGSAASAMSSAKSNASSAMRSGMGGASSTPSSAMGGISSANNSGMAMTNAINTAAFMVIHNCTGQAESIVKATSNLDGMTSLMNFEVKDGKSQMTNITQIDLPVGKKVELKSGSYHVMFMNLKQDLKPGDRVQVTLTFKNAGEITVTPTVKNK